VYIEQKERIAGTTIDDRCHLVSTYNIIHRNFTPLWSGHPNY